MLRVIILLGFLSIVLALITNHPGVAANFANFLFFGLFLMILINLVNYEDKK